MMELRTWRNHVCKLLDEMYKADHYLREMLTFFDLPIEKRDKREKDKCSDMLAMWSFQCSAVREHANDEWLRPLLEYLAWPDPSNWINKLHQTYSTTITFDFHSSEQLVKRYFAAVQLVTGLKSISENRLLANSTKCEQTIPCNVSQKADSLTTVKPRHNADFTMVNWFGTEFTFALGVQSSAVKVLWTEWENTGLGLNQQTIRDRIDSERDNFRMVNCFRNHPAMGAMIHSDGKGIYRLVQPKQTKGETEST